MDEEFNDWVTTVLDGRAQTSDGLSFHIVFTEFNGAEGDLTFSAEELQLDTAELHDLATQRYNDLRTSTYEQHGGTPGIMP